MILVGMALQPPFLAAERALLRLGHWAPASRMTQGRTILQIVAPPTHRARLMSLFQLGLGGGGPIGAFIAGTLASVLGLKLAMVLPALAMAVLIAIVLVFSRIWTMRTVTMTASRRIGGYSAARRGGRGRASARRPAAPRPAGSCRRRNAAASA